MYDPLALAVATAKVSRCFWNDGHKTILYNNQDV